jgi:hypothetical protein
MSAGPSVPHGERAVTIPSRGTLCVCAGSGRGSLESAMPKTTTFEHGGRIYEVRAIPTLKGWMVRIFIDGIPANGFTYSFDSEIYQDAALNRVPEDLVAGLMETAERDFRRGLLQELMTAEKATDDDIAAEIDKFKPPRSDCFHAQGSGEHAASSRMNTATTTIKSALLGLACLWLPDCAGGPPTDKRPDKTKLAFWKSFLRHSSLRHGRPGGVNRRAIIAPRPGAAPKRKA